MDIDLYPLTIRGPMSTNTSGVVTFARMFTRGDRLYIAESRDRGRTTTVVTSYPLPEGAPTKPGRQAKWGLWAYSSCGCGNQWNSQSIDSLVALDSTPVSP